MGSVFIHSYHTLYRATNQELNSDLWNSKRHRSATVFPLPVLLSSELNIKYISNNVLNKHRIRNNYLLNRKRLSSHFAWNGVQKCKFQAAERGWSNLIFDSYNLNKFLLLFMEASTHYFSINDYLLLIHFIITWII